METLEREPSDKEASDQDSSDDDTSDEDTSNGGALKRDWAMSLTAGGTTGAEMFPAKFTFDVTAAPTISCKGTSGVGCALKLTQSGLL
jgi:hypothetical protein